MTKRKNYDETFSDAPAAPDLEQLVQRQTELLHELEVVGKEIEELKRKE